MAKPKKDDLDLFVPVGAAGTWFFDGLYNTRDPNEYVPNLQGQKAIETFSKMSRSDGQVAMLIDAITLPIISATWQLKPPPEAIPQEIEATERVHDWIFEETSFNFSQVLKEACEFIFLGFYPFEKVYRLTSDEKIIVDRLQPRIPSSIVEWHVENDDLTAIRQQINAGKTTRDVVIPRNKLLYFVYDKSGADYRGRSVLRRAYKHWFFKDTLYRVQAVAMERQGIGIPKITLGKNVGKQARTAAINAGKGLRGHEQAYVLAPDGVDIELMDMGSNKILDPQTAIDHHDQALAKSILAQFLELGMKGEGARNLGDTQKQMFLGSIQWVANYMAKVFQQDLISDLMTMNFSPSLRWPRFTVQGIEPDAFDQTTRALQQLGSSGYITNDFETENHFRQLLGLPERQEPEETDLLPEPPENSEDGADVDTEQLAVKGGHVHELQDGSVTGPPISKGEEHYHETATGPTSTNAGGEGHTHSYDGDKQTGKPITHELSALRRTQYLLQKEKRRVLASIVVQKEQFPEQEDAERVVNRYDGRIKKIDETDTAWRFRQRPPSDFVEDSFRTFKPEEGVSLLFGELVTEKRSSKRDLKESAYIVRSKTVTPEIRDVVKEIKRADPGEAAGSVFLPWRPLRPAEENVNLRAIFGRMDDAKEQIVIITRKARKQAIDQLLPQMQAAVETKNPKDLLKIDVDDEILDSFTEQFVDVLRNLYEFGQEQVEIELQRSKRRDADNLLQNKKVKAFDKDKPLFDPTNADDFFEAEALQQSEVITEQMVNSARDRASAAQESGVFDPAQEAEAMGTLSENTVRKSAGVTASTALNFGRSLAANINEDEIEVAEYSAIGDLNTCGPCLEMDGKQFKVGSPEYQQSTPPLRSPVACEGLDRCRCIWVYISKEETPAEA